MINKKHSAPNNTQSSESLALLAKLKSVRIAKKRTQQEIAQAIGISQYGYCKLESGKSNMDLGRLFAIAGFLKVKVKLQLR